MSRVGPTVERPNIASWPLLAFVVLLTVGGPPLTQAQAPAPAPADGAEGTRDRADDASDTLPASADEASDAALAETEGHSDDPIHAEVGEPSGAPPTAPDLPSDATLEVETPDTTPAAAKEATEKWQATDKPSDEAEAPRREYYYYFPDGVGAHAFYNPQNFVVQGGLGALYGDRLDTFDWRGGFATVSHSLVRPIRTVRAYGAKRFFWREFVPHAGPGQNYVPNWVWHFLGGGMRTKLMEEFYEDHGFKRPRVWAWLTLYAYHFLNEAVQAAKFKGERRTVDAIADMYFFDWAGALLFQFDVVNRFMSRTLHMREWSYQAQYNPFTQRLFNNGQLYWMRVTLAGPVSLSFLTGEQITSLNLTYTLPKGHQISVGAGPQTKGFIARNNGDTDPTEIVVNMGLYYSVDDNPLVIATYEPKGRHDRDAYTYSGKTIVNLYPSLVRIRRYPIGITIAYHQDALLAGATFGLSPIGLVLSTPELDEIGR